MFQTLFKRAFTNNSSTSAIRQFARYESTFQTRSRAKEIRQVQLIGTIYQDPMTLKDGGKLITVRTFQPDGNYKVHRALISSQKILELVGDNLSLGQRVYISGELRSTSFQNNENQNRQMFQVRVSEIYASKLNDSEVVTRESLNSTSKKTIDHNSVSILAHIASDIQHFDNHSRFFVASHFELKNPSEAETLKVAFFNVFVHDSNLIEELKSNFQKRDRVFINGFMGSKQETDQNGQKKYGGHIEATNILRVDRFSEANNENRIEANE